MILLCGSIPASFLYLLIGGFLLMALVPFYLLYSFVKRTSLWTITLAKRGGLVKAGFILLLYALTAGVLAGSIALWG